MAPLLECAAHVFRLHGSAAPLQKVIRALARIDGLRFTGDAAVKNAARELCETVLESCADSDVSETLRALASEPKCDVVHLSARETFLKMRALAPLEVENSWRVITQLLGDASAGGADSSWAVVALWDGLTVDERSVRSVLKLSDATWPSASAAPTGGEIRLRRSLWRLRERSAHVLGHVFEDETQGRDFVANALQQADSYSDDDLLELASMAFDICVASPAQVPPETVLTFVFAAAEAASNDAVFDMLAERTAQWARLADEAQVATFADWLLQKAEARVWADAELYEAQNVGDAVLHGLAASTGHARVEALLALAAVPWQFASRGAWAACAAAAMDAVQPAADRIVDTRPSQGASDAVAYFFAVVRLATRSLVDGFDPEDAAPKRAARFLLADLPEIQTRLNADGALEAVDAALRVSLDDLAAEAAQKYTSLIQKYTSLIASTSKPAPLETWLAAAAKAKELSTVSAVGRGLAGADGPLKTLAAKVSHRLATSGDENAIAAGLVLLDDASDLRLRLARRPGRRAPGAARWFPQRAPPSKRPTAI